MCFFKSPLLLQIYTTYSMMTGLLVTIAIGFLIVLILAVILITIMFWFDNDPIGNVQISDSLTTATRAEDELKSDFGFNLDLATALKALIILEGLLYVVINVRMLKKWVSFKELLDIYFQPDFLYFCRCPWVS